MKNFRFACGVALVAICLLAVAHSSGGVAAPEQFCVQIQLIWGTNDQESPDPKHKAIDEPLAKKLGKSPFRWKHYFEVNRQVVCLPSGEAKTGIKLSSHCILDLKNLGKERLETKLYGKGKLLETRKDQMAKDMTLILAGNAENETAWLVVIKRIDAAEAKGEKSTPKSTTPK